MAWPAGVSVVDAAMLAVLAVSVLIGLWRGLLFEVMSLVGWLVAYGVARIYAPTAQTWWPEAPQALAFAGVFIAALVLWSLVARLVRLLLRATPLALVDRLLGAVFGALRGAVLLLAVATVVAMTPAARSPAWQQSQGAAWLQVVMDGLRPLLPSGFGRYLAA